MMILCSNFAKLALPIDDIYGVCLCLQYLDCFVFDFTTYIEHKLHSCISALFLTISI